MIRLSCWILCKIILSSQPLEEKNESKWQDRLSWLNNPINKQWISTTSICCNLGDRSLNLNFGKWTVHLVNIVQSMSKNRVMSLGYLGITLIIFLISYQNHYLDFLLTDFSCFPHFFITMGINWNLYKVINCELVQFFVSVKLKVPHIVVAVGERCVEYI